MSTNDFREQILIGFWHDLKTHADRDAVIVVDLNLDLSDVADQIIRDQLALVQGWVEQSQIGKPSPEQLLAWSEMPTKEFRFVIVQPYVLIQEMEH